MTRKRYSARLKTAGRANRSRASRTGGRIPLMTPRKRALAVEVPLSQSSHLSHEYVCVKVVILDSAPMKATEDVDRVNMQLVACTANTPGKAQRTMSPAVIAYDNACRTV